MRCSSPTKQSTRKLIVAPIVLCALFLKLSLGAGDGSLVHIMVSVQGDLLVLHLKTHFDSHLHICMDGNADDTKACPKVRAHMNICMSCRAASQGFHAPHLYMICDSLVANSRMFSTGWINHYSVERKPPSWLIYSRIFELWGIASRPSYH